MCTTTFAHSARMTAPAGRKRSFRSCHCVVKESYTISMGAVPLVPAHILDKDDTVVQRIWRTEVLCLARKAVECNGPRHQVDGRRVAFGTSGLPAPWAVELRGKCLRAARRKQGRPTEPTWMGRAPNRLRRISRRRGPLAIVLTEWRERSQIRR